MLAVVADGDDGHLGLLDERDQFLDASAVRSSHPVHFVHDNQLLLETAAAAAAFAALFAALFAAAFRSEGETLAIRITQKYINK